MSVSENKVHLAVMLTLSTSHFIKTLLALENTAGKDKLSTEKIFFQFYQDHNSPCTSFKPHYSSTEYFINA